MSDADDWGREGRPLVSAVGGPVRAGAYVRVYSTPADPVQDRLSLETQLTWCLEECERRGWTLSESFTDLGVASPDGAPALQRALEAAVDGVIDVLVTARDDRIAAGPGALAALAARLHPVALVAGGHLVEAAGAG